MSEMLVVAVTIIVIAFFGTQIWEYKKKLDHRKMMREVRHERRKSPRGCPL